MSTWSVLRESRVTVPPHVVLRAFTHETVVLNVRTGQYHGIDPIGGRFLEVMQETPTLGAASQRLADEYSQPLARIEDDLTAFVDELLGRELIVIVRA